MRRATTGCTNTPPALAELPKPSLQAGASASSPIRPPRPSGIVSDERAQHLCPSTEPRLHPAQERPPHGFQDVLRGGAGEGGPPRALVARGRVLLGTLLRRLRPPSANPLRLG